MIKSELRANLPIVSTKEEMMTALYDAHNGLKNDRAKFMRLVESMPRRMVAAIQAEGGPTKY